MKVTELEGVNIPQEIVFNALGVSTVSQCYTFLLNITDQQEKNLTESLGWSSERLETLLNHCEMMLSIKGCSTSNLTALRAVEADSISVLSECDPVELHRLIVEMKNSRKIKLYKVPSCVQVKEWVEAAKNIANIKDAKYAA